MKVKLDHKYPYERDRSRHRQCYPWSYSAPFLVNPRAMLTHRIRYAHTYFSYGKISHHSFIYWCGNIGRGRVVHDPPDNRLVCFACETAAVAHGEKSSHELVGRHVCLGRVKIGRVCCRNEGN